MKKLTMYFFSTINWDHYTFRMFQTKQEKLDHLESYKTMLQNEIKGIDEYIEKMNQA